MVGTYPSPPFAEGSRSHHEHEWSCTPPPPPSPSGCEEHSTLPSTNTAIPSSHRVVVWCVEWSGVWSGVVWCGVVWCSVDRGAVEW